MNHSKAQASYEMVLIATIIIVLTSVVLANFVPLKNETLGIAAARESAVAELAATGKPYIIQRIDFTKPSANEYKFTFFTQNPVENLDLIMDSAKINKICDAIKNATDKLWNFKISIK